MFAHFSCIAVLALLASGCANTSPTLGSKNISYGDTKAVETVTNEFGSTDLQMIAESMTRSLAQSGILQGRPVVQVYDVVTENGRPWLSRWTGPRRVERTPPARRRTGRIARRATTGRWPPWRAARSGRRLQGR